METGNVPDLRLVITDRGVPMKERRRQARERRPSKPPPRVKLTSDRQKERPKDVSVHVLVPPDENEAFKKWRKACGFANVSSIGIQIGGIGGIAHDRRRDLAVLGPRAMVAGVMASLLNATVAGMLLG